MPTLQEPFEIAYCGVTVEIIPVVFGSDVHYIVKLPTREIILETAFDDENEIDCWQEIPAVRTEIAQEIGSLIESKYM